MVEILFLPVRPLGSEQCARLCEDLAAAHARGQDLGSRVPHIRADCGRLLELSHVFEDAIDDLDWTLTELGLQDPTASEALRTLVSMVVGLVDTTQRLSSGA